MFNFLFSLNVTIDNKLQSQKEDQRRSINDVPTGNTSKSYSLANDNTEKNDPATKRNVKENHVFILKVKENVTIADDGWATVKESVKEGINELNVRKIWTCSTRFL